MLSNTPKTRIYLQLNRARIPGLHRLAPAACIGTALALAGCGGPAAEPDAGQDANPAAETDTTPAPAPDTAAETPSSDDMPTEPTFSRSLQLPASAADVWSSIGGYCAVADWHPAVETCTLDGQTPPTRTLHIAGGDAIFVELETARDDAAYTYSYTILSGPLPVSDYVGTLTVEDTMPGVSTITWSSVYTAHDGQDEAAAAALTGIYDSGLAAILASMAD